LEFEDQAASRRRTRRREEEKKKKAKGTRPTQKHTKAEISLTPKSLYSTSIF